MHYGNGTAELLKNDPRAFFASVHMLYHDGDEQSKTKSSGDRFYPEPLGKTEISSYFVSVALMPPLKSVNKNQPKGQEQGVGDVDEVVSQVGSHLRGSSGYRRAIEEIIIPRLVQFNPQLLIISGISPPNLSEFVMTTSVAGFDGYSAHPIGGELNLSIVDYKWSTTMVCMHWSVLV